MNATNNPAPVTLDGLLSEGFVAEIGIATSAKTLRRCLHTSAYVSSVRRAIAQGVISEVAVRRFVERLSRDFSRGIRFPHERTLAAIAVALEERKTEFVEEYLLDLARLNIVEMPFAPEVARECYKRW